MAKLKPKQNVFLLALLQSNTTEEAIKASKIERHTAYNYLRDPDFIAALREARRDLVLVVSLKLSSAGEDAVATLMSIVQDDSAPPSSRVSASRTILEYFYRSYENDELLKRIETLEEQLDH